MLPELKTFLIAMSPIIELRGSIPIAITLYKMPVWSAYLFSVLGNLVPLILIVLLGDSVARFLSGKSYFFNRFFNWLFDHTRDVHSSKFSKWGKGAAVVLLTATPIPFIGGWTGAIAAFVFGVPFFKAAGLLVIGSSIAGIIVTVLTLGAQLAL